MPLKAILETLDDVPEQLHELYVENDGGYVLDVDESVENLPRIKTLKNAYERVKEQHKGAASELKELRALKSSLPEDFDPTEIETLRAKAQKSGEPDEHVAKIREQLERKFQSEVGTREEHIAKLERALDKLVVDNGLDASLDKAGIAPKFKAAARALLRERGVVKRIEDGDAFVANVETDMGPMDVAEFVKSWAASEEGRAFVAPAEGGGATGNNRSGLGEPNPFAKGNWNKTAQGRLLMSDRNKAERLAKAAGFADIDSAKRAAAPVQ